MFWFSVPIIILGLCIDIGTFYLGMRRLRGDGPSGVPVVGFVVVASGLAVLCIGDAFTQAEVLGLAKVYGLIHIMLNFGILLIADVVLRIFGK